MFRADPAVEAKIREAVTHGAVDKLRVLAQQFPDSFEALRDDTLVDLAVQQKQAGAALYLILHHGFEVSPMFEYDSRSYLGDLFAAGVNQYHVTLEVMSSAALNFGYENGRSLACYALRQFADQLRRGEQPLPTHPEFLRAVAHGDLARFTEKFMRDERFEMCGQRHSCTMLKDFATHHDAMTEYALRIRREAAGKARGDRSIG